MGEKLSKEPTPELTKKHPEANSAGLNKEQQTEKERRRLQNHREHTTNHLAGEIPWQRRGEHWRRRGELTAARSPRRAESPRRAKSAIS